MQLTLNDDLPFTTVQIKYNGIVVEIPNILVDTGSCSTLFSVDAIIPLGITPELTDMLYTIRGVGGTEVVFVRKVEYLQVGHYRLENCNIEVGGMDYGFEINGILGMDFLLSAQAIINLQTCQLDFISSMTP